MLSLPLEISASRIEHEAMNCLFLFVLEEADEAYREQAAQAAAGEVDRLEDLLSLYREHSDVNRINGAVVGEELHVAEETAACLAEAMRIAAATEGAFHPFCGRAALRSKEQALPDGAEDGAVADGDPVLELDLAASRVVKRRSGPLLDLGGIGKGFALDRAASLLREEWEIPGGLLVAGGSSVVAFSAAGKAWKIRSDEDDEASCRSLANGALAASGLGFQPGHIIDPQHERPVSGERRAWVYAPTGAMADGLSTAAVALPEDRLAAVFQNMESVSVRWEEGGRRGSVGSFFTPSTPPRANPSEPSSGPR